MSALATPDDLEARLGRNLTPDELARVEALLADASALVRSYTGRDFSRHNDVTVTLRGPGGEVRLPQTPVIDVSAVVAVGSFGLDDMPLVDWGFDGIDLLRIGTNACVINMPADWWDLAEDGWPDTFRVTYSYGQETVPADVVAVVAAMALRTLTAPTMQGGITGETIGSYSYRLDGGASTGLAVSMSAADRRALARYRHHAGTIMVRR